MNYLAFFTRAGGLTVGFIRAGFSSNDKKLF